MADGNPNPQWRPPQDRQPPHRPRWPMAMNVLLIALALFYGVQLFHHTGPRPLSYTAFKQKVEAGKVASVVLKGHEITGTLKHPAGTSTQGSGKAESGGGQNTGKQSGAAKPSPHFQTTIPVFTGDSLLTLLEKHDVKIDARPTGEPWWQTLLISFLPWLLILGLIYFASTRMRKQMQGSQQGIFGFGQAKAQRFRETRPETTFSDVAGSENAKRDLSEVVDYLSDPDHFRKLGAKLPSGLLMVGPPGTGKTLLARAVAGEARVPFFSIAASEFIEMFVGVGASRVRDLFRKARAEAPAIIFVDELDAVGRARGAGVGGGHDEREQTLNQILSEMDGFSPQEAVVVIAATNRPDVLDPALLRPGRFDRKVLLDRPHREARARILELHSKKVPLAEDVDLEVIARRTVGFSGADLENLVNEAALLAGRDRQSRLAMRHFDLARDKILLGAEREQKLTDEQKRVIAYHESGHAITARLFPKADPLEKVTIIPRGQALGVTQQTPDEDRLNLTVSDARARIAVMLGGRVAENLVFGEVSSGAENDIEQATGLARRMISRWGMSEVVGPVSYKTSSDEVFLGREIARERDFSEQTARVIDEQVKRLILDLESQVSDRLRRNRHYLDALVAALLERETLESPEIERILDEADSTGTDSEKRRAAP